MPNCYDPRGAAESAVRDQNHEWLAHWLSQEFQVHVDPESVKTWLQADRSLLLPYWSDASWRMWFKNRLSESGAFGCSFKKPPHINLPVTLHVGFVGLFESEEELRVLRNEHLLDDEDIHPVRSRLFRQVERDYIQGIDNTARTVGGHEPAKPGEENFAVD